MDVGTKMMLTTTFSRVLVDAWLSPNSILRLSWSILNLTSGVLPRINLPFFAELRGCRWGNA
jgi:hypothetical protein